MNVTIYWKCTRELRKKIVSELRLPDHINLNGETEVRDDLIDELKLHEQNGHLKIRRK